ncbi:ZN415-like protein, partial [Mya arenaria]
GSNSVTQRVVPLCFVPVRGRLSSREDPLHPFCVSNQQFFASAIEEKFVLFLNNEFIQLAAGSDEMVGDNMIPLGAETIQSGSVDANMHSYTLDAEMATTVNYGQLKPIIMTMANMANVSEEVQVSTQEAFESPEPELSENVDHGVTYEILKGGTRRGGDRLIDSLGFMYNLKRSGSQKSHYSKKDVTYWWCAVRNNKLRCPAVVVQKGKSFMRGKRKHEHLVGQHTPKPHRHGVNQPTVSEQITPKRRVSSQKKPICKDDTKRYWICSVRNKHLRCPAMVIQRGNEFTEGSLEHKHLPQQRYPAGPHDIIPRHGVHEAYSDLDEYDDEEEGSEDHKYIESWESSARRNSEKKYLLNRERKRKDHPTFLGPSCTINLTKCDTPNCNCKMVHCPFCDPSHFIPAKAGRGIPDRLLVLPDSKYPDVINAYGFEIPICKKAQCSTTNTRDKHYHCPQCQLHFSHFKSFSDIPLTNILKCFQACEGLDRSFCKTRFHFHCPICCKMILTKGSFEDHLRGCHLFKFGENLVNELLLENAADDDIALAEEMTQINENVEYMEHVVTSQAVAQEELARKRVVKSELNEMLEGDSEAATGETYADVDLTDDILGLNVNEDEIFDLGTMIFSEKLVRALRSTAAVNSVLGKVSNLTNTKLTEEDGRYMLCGKIDDMLAAKELIVKTIRGSESDFEEETSPMKTTTRSSGKKSKMVGEELDNGGKIKTQSKTEKPKGKTKGKIEVVEIKKERGRPKKKGDKFPYSEIEEIIEASKKTEKGKRGRPPKKLAAPTQKKNTDKPVTSTPIAPTATPGRYSTRGIKRNYLDMSMGKVEVKEEVMSDDEVQDDDDDEEENEEVIDETPVRARGRKAGGRRVRKQEIEEDESYDQEEENEDQEDEEGREGIESLDDSEQEEMDQTSENEESAELDSVEELDRTAEENGDEDNEVDGTPKQKEVVFDAEKGKDTVDIARAREKITDSTVKSLKTSNVTSSVPLISKVGIRPVKVGRKKDNEEFEEALNRRIGKAAERVTGDTLMCSLCDEYVAEVFSDLTSHLKTFHHVYEPPRCDVCEVDFDTNQTLMMHIERKHGPKLHSERFKCTFDDCGKLFQSQPALTGHINRVHLEQKSGASNKIYTCEICQYETISQEELLDHKKLDHDADIKCKPCSLVFDSYQALKAHTDQVHDGELFCDHCDQTFPNRPALQRHMKQHSSTHAFTCHICAKVLSTKASLEDHVECHKPASERTYRYFCGNRPYKCDQCTKMFGFRSMLKKHKKFVHSTERPYKCGYCMKGFKFMNLLNNHMVIHTNTSKHKCSYCQKVFSVKSSLKYHMKKCGQVPTTIVIQGVPGSTSMAGRTLPPQQQQHLQQPQQQQQQEVMVILNSKSGLPTNIVSVPESDILSSALGLRIQSDHSQGPSIANASDILPAGQSLLTNNVLAMGSNNVSMATNTVMEPNTVTMDANNVAMETETVAMDTGSVAMGDSLDTEVGSSGLEVEVYACSECNAAFASFQEAETHVLTAHPAVPFNNA